MTDQERDRRFEVRFSGKELLCVPDPEEVIPALRISARHINGGKRPQSDLDADCSAVMACFQQRPCSRGEIRYVTGLSEDHLSTAMTRLQREGQIERMDYGLWRKHQ